MVGQKENTFNNLEAALLSRVDMGMWGPAIDTYQNRLSGSDFHVGLNHLLWYLSFHSMDSFFTDWAVNKSIALVHGGWDENEIADYYRALGSELSTTLIDRHDYHDSITKIFDMYGKLFSLLERIFRENSSKMVLDQIESDGEFTPIFSVYGGLPKWDFWYHHKLLGLIQAYINPSNWYPAEAPVYVWVEDVNLPTGLGRFMYSLQNDDLRNWLSAFDNHLMVPFNKQLKIDQLDGIWSGLFAKDIYGSSLSDTQKRLANLDAMKGLFPKSGKVVDLGGGPGYLLAAAQWYGDGREAIIFDASKLAVQQARELGFEAQQVDLREGLPEEVGEADYINALYSAQWFSEVLQEELPPKMKKGARFGMNVYPVGDYRIAAIQKALEEAGMLVRIHETRHQREVSDIHGNSGEVFSVKILEAVK